MAFLVLLLGDVVEMMSSPFYSSSNPILKQRLTQQILHSIQIEIWKTKLLHKAHGAEDSE